VKECSFLHRLTLVSLWYLNSKLRNMTEWCGVGKNAWPKMTSSSDLRGHWGLKFGVWSYFHRYVNLTEFHRNRWLWLHFLDGLTRDDPDALWLLYQRFVSLVKCEWFRSRCLFCICTYGALRHDTLCILPQNFAIKKKICAYLSFKWNHVRTALPTVFDMALWQWCYRIQCSQRHKWSCGMRNANTSLEILWPVWIVFTFKAYAIGWVIW